MPKTKNYDKSFKREVALLKINGGNTSSISKKYKVAKSTVLKWAEEYRENSGFSETAVVNSDDEIKRLQKEIERLQKENAVLKQAVLIIGNSTQF